MSDINKCIHCGDDCGRHPVLWNDVKFCCNGCKAVYQLLNEKNLHKYYEIEKTPGIRVDSTATDNQYKYLDKDEVQEKLFEFAEGDIVKVRFYIPVIHCASCIWLLEHLNSLDKGIIKSSVNFIKKEVSITFNKYEISLRRVVELLVSIHYKPEITLDTLDAKDTKKSDKVLLYKK